MPRQVLEDTLTADSVAADAALAASGDASAFERLYRTHIARIHSLVRRMLDADEADDLAQDIFVRAWQKLGTFRGESAFGTWLHRLAVNVVLARWLSEAENLVAASVATEAAKVPLSTPGMP